MEWNMGEKELTSPQFRQAIFAEEMFGSAALVVVGEASSEDHKASILERIIKGFSTWDPALTGCDINRELDALANEAPCGVVGSNGEHTVKHGSDEFQLEILINPRQETLRDALRLLLLPPTKHKHLIFAGYSFTGTGDWIVQDGTWSAADLAAVFKHEDVALSLAEQKGSSLTICCGPSSGGWTQTKLTKSVIGQSLSVTLNPENQTTDVSGLARFTAYLELFIQVTPTESLLPASDNVGNIRFTSPCLYVFPAAQGDCAVFGVDGFNMLLDGGFSRHACFWEFISHVDKLDMLLLSRVNQNNLFGIKSLLSRCLSADKDFRLDLPYSCFNHPLTGIKEKECALASSLSVSLVEEASIVSSYLTKIGCKPNRVHASPTPVQLFSRIGHGTLDMYVLTPQKDSPDYKEMMKQWSSAAEHFSNDKAGVPLNDVCSLAVVLVWKSHSGQVTRILYPGSAPQSQIFKGLDQLKNLDIFQRPHTPEANGKVSEETQSAKLSGKGKKPAGSSAVKSTREMSRPAASATPSSAMTSTPGESLQMDIPSSTSDHSRQSPLLTERLPDVVASEEVSVPSPRDVWVNGENPTMLPEPSLSPQMLVDTHSSVDDVSQATPPVLPEKLTSHTNDFVDEDLDRGQEIIESTEASIPHINNLVEEDGTKNIPPAEDAIPPASDVIPPDEDVIPPAEDVIPPAEDAIPPAEDVIPPAEDVIPPAEDIIIPPAEDLMSPAEDVMSPAEDVIPPAEDVMSPAEDAIPPAEVVTPPAEDLMSPAEDFIPPAEDVTSPAKDIIIPPAEDLMSPAEDVMSPANDVIPPAEDVMPPAEDVIAPAEDIIPPAEDVIPQGDDVLPTSYDMQPSGDVMPPGGDDFTQSNDDPRDQVNIHSEFNNLGNSSQTGSVEDIMTSSDDVTPTGELPPLADSAPTHDAVGLSEEEGAAGEPVVTSNDAGLSASSTELDHDSAVSGDNGDILSADALVASSGNRSVSPGAVAETDRSVTAADFGALSEQLDSLNIDGALPGVNNNTPQFSPHFGASSFQSSQDQASDILIPDTEDMTPNTEDLTPDTKDLTPGTEGLTPDTNDMTLYTENLTPGTEDLTPGTEDLTPGTEDLTPGTEDLTPGTENLTPGTEDLTPKSDESPSADSSEIISPPGSVTAQFDNLALYEGSKTSGEYKQVDAAGPAEPLESLVEFSQNSPAGVSEECNQDSLAGVSEECNQDSLAGVSEECNQDSLAGVSEECNQDSQLTGVSEECNQDSQLTGASEECNQNTLLTGVDDNQQESGSKEVSLEGEAAAMSDPANLGVCEMKDPLIASDDVTSGAPDDVAVPNTAMTDSIIGSLTPEHNTLTEASSVDAANILLAAKSEPTDVYSDLGAAHPNNGVTNARPSTQSCLDSRLNPLAPAFTPSPFAVTAKSAGPLSYAAAVTRPLAKHSKEVEFDPLKDWGEPQSLPLPPSPSPVDSAKAAEETRPSTSSSANESQKPSASNKAAPRKSLAKSSVPKTSAKSSSADAAKPAASGASKRSSYKPAAGLKKAADDSKKSAGETSKAAGDTAAGKKPAKPAQSRLKSAASTSAAAEKPKAAASSAKSKQPLAKADPPKSKPSERKLGGDVKPRSAAVDKPKAELRKPKAVEDVTKKPRPTSSTKVKPSTSRLGAPASSGKAGSPGPAASVPFYVDVAYVPHHGDGKYVGPEYFQRIRSSKYIFSGLNNNVEPFEALLSGKKAWPKDPVTVIPTYDTSVIDHWVADHSDQLGKLNIRLATSAARSLITILNGGSFHAARLEF